MIYHQDSTYRDVDGPVARVGWIPIPLTSLREVFTNNMTNIAGNGGVMASDTTPIFEFTNGDTDSALRLRWASSNSDAVAWTIPLPPDLDPSNPIYVKFIAEMGGATDTPTVLLETFFGKGDTKISDSSAAVTGTTAAVYTITIAAADIETNVRKLFASFEFTPGAHTTDTFVLYALWMEYTKR
jgi:hypothetical protein